MIDLTGRTVLITGASHGISYETARVLGGGWEQRHHPLRWISRGRNECDGRHSRGQKNDRSG